MIGERIKKLRKTLDLTQQGFCEQIGVKRNTIAKYETNRGEPIDAVISLICREFNVNEKWLRTGEGEMFVPESSFDLEKYIKQRRITDLELQILKAYFDLDSDLREKLLEHFKERLTVEQKKPTPVFEDGLEAQKKALMDSVYRMSPAQKQMYFDQMSKLREPQTEASPFYAPPKSDKKVPESEHPDQS